MMIELKKMTNETKMQEAKALYLTAFPKEERKPFELMIKKQEEGVMELLSIEEGGEFIGLAFTVKEGDLVLLDYFAIAEKKRSGGFGSRALKAILSYYEGCRLFLEIENTMIPAPNSEERSRRKSFYLRNGLVPLPYLVVLFGVEMEMLSNGTPVSYEEYFSLYEKSFGPKTANYVRFLRELSL